MAIAINQPTRTTAEKDNAETLTAGAQLLHIVDGTGGDDGQTGLKRLNALQTANNLLSLLQSRGVKAADFSADRLDQG